MRYSIFSVNDHHPRLARTVPQLYSQVMRQCELGEAAYAAGKYESGAKLFEKITLGEYVEFLTLPAYDLID